MILFKQALALTEYLDQLSAKKERIGFVPTMGALHAGHLSLVHAASKENDIVVCSIFVNPTQFNNADDFAKYPVTIEHDIELLEGSGCDVLFLPSVAEIYPAGYSPKHYDLGKIETILEGEYRPGHFQGVCQVVDRLLTLVNPGKLYLGQKDYQQCQVIQRLLTLTQRNAIDLVIAPTVREEDGLAMSSRNMRLSASQRLVAPAIFQELSKAKTNFRQLPPDQIKADAANELQRQGFRVDYFELMEATALSTSITPTSPAVALVAAYLGDIRLIDNLPLN